MCGNTFEHLCRHTPRRPVGHVQATTRSDNTRKFCHDLFRLRCKHGADHADGHIEAVIDIGQVFSIADIELSIQVFERGAFACVFNQILGNINTGYPMSALCGRNGALSRATTDVQ